MKIIGLTGGIGSGKSTVADFFSLLGIAIYKADDAAKSMMIADELLISGIKKLFGADEYESGILNRKFIAEQVFSNPELLSQLNALVHPAVKRDFMEWIKIQQSPYIIREAAILFESGSYQDCDKVITVFAPEKERISRVMLRDGLSEAEVIKRIQNQWSDERKIQLSDFVINNYENHLIIPQVMKIHELLTKKD